MLTTAEKSFSKTATSIAVRAVTAEELGDGVEPSAIARASRPAASTADASAPNDSSARTCGPKPRRAHCISTVSPSLAASFTLTPHSPQRYATILSCPVVSPSHAKKRTDRPVLPSVACGSAPAST